MLKSNWQIRRDKGIAVVELQHLQSFQQSLKMVMVISIQGTGVTNRQRKNGCTTTAEPTMGPSTGPPTTANA
jgi:hypothetical protein